MKFVRAYPWFFAGSLLAVVPQALFAEVLPETSFRDWAGFVNVVELYDGSKLFEYSAQSLSGNAADSVLSISFVPRFSCVPMVRLLVPESDLDEDEAYSIEVSLGKEPVVYRGFLDTDGSDQVYSVVASTNSLAALRENLDAASTVRVRVLADNSQSAGNATAVTESEISLSGSTLSTAATEMHCRMHSPQDY